MAPEKKRRRQCQGCRNHFSNIASHWLRSSNCHAPGTSATGTAGRSPAAAATAPGRTNVLLDVQQEEEETDDSMQYPDDLSTTDRSIPLDNHNEEDEASAFDNADLYEMFIANCSNPSSRSSQPSSSSNTIMPLDRDASESPAVSTGTSFRSLY